MDKTNANTTDKLYTKKETAATAAHKFNSNTSTRASILKDFG